MPEKPAKPDPVSPKKVKPSARRQKKGGLFPHDYVTISIIAQLTNNLIRAHYKQEQSRVPVSPEVIKAVLAAPRFDPAESHRRWRAARIKAGWKGGAYNQTKKRHPNLKAAGWHELPFKERVKDWTFFAAVVAAAAALEHKNSGEEKKLKAYVQRKIKKFRDAVLKTEAKKKCLG